MVAEEDFFEKYGFDGSSDYDVAALQRRILADDEALSHVLRNAKFDTPVRTLVGYSANVKHLAQRNYALLGNAGEFLDPVFSSGVTIALKSSSMVVPLVDQYIKGENIDWMEQYEKPLRAGIQVFRAYVEAWYTGEFQNVVFSNHQENNVRSMIASLLAGYAWDQTNPIYKNAKKRLSTIAEYCREDQ